jgi:hypothetical protein
MPQLNFQYYFCETVNNGINEFMTGIEHLASTLK